MEYCFDFLLGYKVTIVTNEFIEVCKNNQIRYNKKGNEVKGKTMGKTV